MNEPSSISYGELYLTLLLCHMEMKGILRSVQTAALELIHVTRLLMVRVSICSVYHMLSYFLTLSVFKF